MKKLTSKQITLIIAILVIIVVGGLWVFDSYKARHPQEDKNGKTLITYVDRGIKEEDLPIFQQRVEDIKAELEQAQSEGKVPPSIYLRLGNAYYTLGDLGNAKENYDKILAEYPQDGPAHENLGQALLEMGDPDGALAHWKESLEYVNNEITYFKLADLFAEHFPNRSEEALKLLEYGVENIGQTPGLMVALGNWYKDNGDIERAVSHYKVATVLSPNDKEIKDVLVQLEQVARQIRTQQVQ
ncbi:MAG: tetratricopeptide repeat protein [Patescibacteria group bacterium]